MGGTDEKAEGKIPVALLGSIWKIRDHVLAFVHLEPWMFSPKLLCEGVAGGGGESRAKGCRSELFDKIIFLLTL